MYLVYLGESGNTGGNANDPNQPHHVHVGLVVHESQWVSINGEFDALSRRHFGVPARGAGTPSQIRPADVYQGRGFFSSWKPAQRAELIQDCLNILIRRETPVIIAYANKGDFLKAREPAEAGNGQAPEAAISGHIINRFLFALNMFMDEMNMNTLSHEQVEQTVWPVNDYALVVAAQGRSVAPHFMADFIKDEPDVMNPVVLEKFCYVSPEHSVCTQLANLCAYFARRWLQHPNDPHRYFDALREGRVIQVIYPVQP
jgi:hypothetical protein